MSRKVKEMMLATKLRGVSPKKKFSACISTKSTLATVAYGAEAAARTYFGKHVEELNLSECATLAEFHALLTKNPTSNPARAKLRRDTALQSMLDLNYISKAEYDETLKQPITVFAADPVVAAYFVEEVRQQLEKTYRQPMPSTRVASRFTPRWT